MSYVDLQAEWLRPPGSRAVATRMIEELDKLPAATIRKVDNKQLRQMAGKLHKKYGSASKKFGPAREDLMNLLEIVASKGLKGLRDAVGRKEFLLTIAAIGLSPTIFRLSSQGDGPIQEKWRRPIPFALLLPRI